VDCVLGESNRAENKQDEQDSDHCGEDITTIL